jgi:HEPN domain-containing protein
MPERHLDWLHQARLDLDHARLAAREGHHEWAVFAAQQAAEKACKALHMSGGGEAWGHDLTTLLGAINSRVQEDDTLWILGDFCWGDFTDAKRYRERITCRKVHFVWGNHDKQFLRPLFGEVDLYDFLVIIHRSSHQFTEITSRLELPSIALSPTLFPSNTLAIGDM